MRRFATATMMLGAFALCLESPAIGLHGGGGGGGFRGGGGGGFHGGGGGFGGGGFGGGGGFSGGGGFGGGGRPSLPAGGSIGSRLPSGGLPGGGGALPGGGASLPGGGGHPGLPGSGLPGAGGGHPSAADLGGFLNLSPRPGGGGGAQQRPALPNAPGGGGRPSLPSAPGGGGRVVDNPFASGHAGNRTAWHDPNGGRAGVRDRLDNAVRPGRGNGRWLDDHPERADQLRTAGDKVRDHWEGKTPGSDWWSKPHPGPGGRPGGDWWSRQHPDLAHWYYHNDWHRHPWNYWWRPATWGYVTGWFAGAAWSNPIYYDYGEGGNIVYQYGDVYVNGEDIGTQEAYAQSAAELATVDPAYDQQPNDAPATDSGDQWLPLGTFAIATSKDDANSTRTIQLAVDKQGVVSGTMYNSTTDKSYVVQGQVDKQTQRVAFTIGDKADIVMETGIYNLTQDQTQVLVHFGTDRTQNYLLVRLDAPQQEGASGEAAEGSDKDPPPREELP